MNHTLFQSIYLFQNKLCSEHLIINTQCFYLINRWVQQIVTIFFYLRLAFLWRKMQTFIKFEQSLSSHWFTLDRHYTLDILAIERTLRSIVIEMSFIPPKQKFRSNTKRAVWWVHCVKLFSKNQMICVIKSVKKPHTICHLLNTNIFQRYFVIH